MFNLVDIYCIVRREYIAVCDADPSLAKKLLGWKTQIWFEKMCKGILGCGLRNIYNEGVGIKSVI
jgi:hypothetical protein